MGQLFNNTNIINQGISIDENTISIFAQFFIHKDYSVTKKDVLLDILAKIYKDQTILIKLLDGENIKFSGFELFIRNVCDKIGIPYEKVTFEFHGTLSTSDFNLTQLKLGIFVSVNQYLPAEFNQNVSNAKFIGCLLGRYNIARFRLAYELDQAFPNDNYMIFQPDVGYVADQLRSVNSIYAEELKWLQHKVFNQDLHSTIPTGTINWFDACRTYGNIWNQYQIEVLSETDSIDNFWFTEKTANCLATGKPFVLMSGQNSLSTLSKMGFQTFSEVLDESYDLESNPYFRIQKLIASLNELYYSKNKIERMQQLYRLAEKNIELYVTYINQ